MGTSLLRALRTRGPLTEKECRAVLLNNRDRIGKAAAHCTKHNGKIVLRAERELMRLLPVNCKDLSRQLRVFYMEQAARLPIKRGPDGMLYASTPLNVVCKQSLCAALHAQCCRIDTALIMAEYPNAHADLISLVAEGKAIIIGAFAWGVPWPQLVPGAAAAWQAHICGSR